MKQLFAALALSWAVSSAWAQGTVIFNTRVPGIVDAPVFWASGPPGPTVKAGLFLVLGEGNSRWYLALAGASFHSPTPEMPALAAYIVPRVQPVFIPGIQPGEQATLIMRVWEGASYESAINSAQSRPVTVTLGGTNSLGEVFPEPYLVGLQGFCLLPLTPPQFPPWQILAYFSREPERLRFDILFIDEWTPWPTTPHNPVNRPYSIWSSTDLQNWQQRVTGSTTQAVATVYVDLPTNSFEFFR